MLLKQAVVCLRVDLHIDITHPYYFVCNWIGSKSSYTYYWEYIFYLYFSLQLQKLLLIKTIWWDIFLL